MKIIEILKFNRELINRLQTAGIRLDDAKYIGLYNDYVEMVQGGEKVSYAVAVVADHYHVSERKVYSLIKRMQSDCNSLIFGGGGG